MSCWENKPTVGAAAITINGYGVVYAESITSGGGFNAGSSHNYCTAASAGATCTPFNDKGKHTGLT